MILLDEQIRADQRVLLSRSRIPFRQIGKDIAPSGTTAARALARSPLEIKSLFNQKEERIRWPNHLGKVAPFWQVVAPAQSG